GILLLAVSMRRSNGYRGLHELASGTRVIRLPSRKKRFRLPRKAVESRGSFPADRPRQIGTFAVRSLVRQADGESLLLGEDIGLQRSVWIWCRPEAEEALPLARCALARGTRSRWLAGGIQEGQRWDAFVAPPGCLLSDAVTPRHRLN